MRKVDGRKVLNRRVMKNGKMDVFVSLEVSQLMSNAAASMMNVGAAFTSFGSPPGRSPDLPLKL